MAWTAPMTAADNTTFTAAQFNANVRDNLLETEGAKATTAGRFFITTGANAIAEREIKNSVVTTAETQNTSGVWGDLATVGPQVTITTGASAMVWFGTAVSQSAANAFASASVEVTGASSIAASFDYCVQIDGLAANNARRYTTAYLFTTLTPGSNVFTMKYRNATSQFSNRELIVMAL